MFQLGGAWSFVWGGTGMGWHYCNRSDRVDSVESVTLWQQVTIEITRRAHLLLVRATCIQVELNRCIGMTIYIGGYGDVADVSYR